MQMKYLAFARKEIVFDVEPVHRFQMTAKHGGRNQLGNFRGFISPCFDGVQRLRRASKFCLSCRTTAKRGRRDPSSSSRNAAGDELLDFGSRFPLDVQEADDNVRDLDAGVVDVVLHIDFPAGFAQQADEGIAKDGVAQMAYVRSLVGINAGMFHQDFAQVNLGWRLRRQRVLSPVRHDSLSH